MVVHLPSAVVPDPVSRMQNVPSGLPVHELLSLVDDEVAVPVGRGAAAASSSQVRTPGVVPYPQIPSFRKKGTKDQGRKEIGERKEGGKMEGTKERRNEGQY